MKNGRLQWSRPSTSVIATALSFFSEQIELIKPVAGNLERPWQIAGTFDQQNPGALAATAQTAVTQRIAFACNPSIHRRAPFPQSFDLATILLKPARQ